MVVEFVKVRDFGLDKDKLTGAGLENATLRISLPASYQLSHVALT